MHEPHRLVKLGFQSQPPGTSSATVQLGLSTEGHRVEGLIFGRLQEGDQPAQEFCGEITGFFFDGGMLCSVHAQVEGQVMLTTPDAPRSARLAPVKVMLRLDGFWCGRGDFEIAEQHFSADATLLGTLDGLG